MYKIDDIIIGEYKVLDIFGGEGKSGMGVVYLVYDRRLEKPIILKTYQKSSLSSINRFKSEAEIWLSIGIHPNIVKSIYVNEVNDQLFIGAEFIEPDEYGRNSISDYLNTQNKISLNYIVKWTAQFCYAMNHAISKGLVVHRDIKPDNLMIDENVNLKVTDFGISKGLYDIQEISNISNQNEYTGLTQEGTFIGTLMYSSPEQILDSSSISYHSDMYSFGIVLYQLISGGNFPYSLKNKTSSVHFAQMHLQDSLIKTEHPLFPIVSKCMARDPRDRYNDYYELLEELKATCNNLNIYLPKETSIDNPILEELYTKCASYITLKQYDKAQQAINEYLEIEQVNSSAWAIKGRIEMHLGNYNNALHPTLKSLNIDPYNTHTLNNLGLIYKNIGNIKKAIYFLEKAVEYDPFNSGALANLSISYGNNKEFQKAASCILKALELAPDKETLQFNAGNIAAIVMKNGLPEASFKILKKLVLLDKENAVNWFNLGLHYESLKDFKNAVICFKNVVRLKPNDEESIFKMVDYTAALGNFEDAISYCDKLIYMNLSETKAFSYKVQIMQLAGNSRDAIRLTKERLLNNYRNDLLCFLLSNLYAKDSDYFNALIYAIKARDLLEKQEKNPQNDNLSLIQEKIEEYNEECIRRNVNTDLEETIVPANEKEMQCIQYADKFYPKVKKGVLKNLFGKKDLSVKYQVSSLKVFSTLWSMYGLRDYGFDYVHRGSFSDTDKLDCLKMWIKILYDIDAEVEKITDQIIVDLSNSRKQMMKVNPGIRINSGNPINIIPEIVDDILRFYE